MSFGNLIYLYLDVGFIQMLKSFAPVIIMAALFLSGIETPSRTVILSILLISVGTAITCSFTTSPHYLGFFYFFLSAVFEAIRMVASQYLVKDLNITVIESQYYLSWPTTACLFVASMISEVPSMILQQKNSTDLLYFFFYNAHFFVLAGLLGIAVNYLTYTVIQITSSLTLKILGTLRNIVLIVIGILFYDGNLLH